MGKITERVRQREARVRSKRSERMVRNMQRAVIGLPPLDDEGHEIVRPRNPSLWQRASAWLRWVP